MLRKITSLGVFVLGFCVMTLQARAQTWTDGDLTVQGGGVNTTGPIALVYDPHANVIRSHYIGGDQHVHELALVPGAWQDSDLTVLGGGPNATGPIATIYDPNANVIRSHYIGNDMDVHELFLDAAGWHDDDVTVAGMGPDRKSVV